METSCPSDWTIATQCDEMTTATRLWGRGGEAAQLRGPLLHDKGERLGIPMLTLPCGEMVNLSSPIMIFVSVLFTAVTLF